MTRPLNKNTYGIIVMLLRGLRTNEVAQELRILPSRVSDTKRFLREAGLDLDTDESWGKCRRILTETKP